MQWIAPPEKDAAINTLESLWGAPDGLKCQFRRLFVECMHFISEHQKNRSSDLAMVEKKSKPPSTLFVSRQIHCFRRSATCCRVRRGSNQPNSQNERH